MAVITSYLNTTKNFEAIINSILGARAPERFNVKFLEDLGFKSSNDRLMVGVFKGLGLIDESGVPTQVYYDFLDQTQSKVIMAQRIQIAYKDLFDLRTDAQNMTNEEIKNKLRTITQGQKGDKVIECMALTFRVLCNYADWDQKIISKSSVTQKSVQNKNEEEVEHTHKPEVYTKLKNDMNLHYNIQIHLPETTNMAVYDAIFQSLKNHLM